jgi:SLT domain-containing protein
MAYGFELVRIASTTVFSLIKIQIQGVTTRVEHFASIIIAVLGGAFMNVANVAVPVINTILRAINLLRDEPIELLSKTEVNIMGDIVAANKQAKEEVLKQIEARKELFKRSKMELELAKETLEIRSASYLKSQVQLPPTGLLKQLGETTDPIDRDTEETDAKIENVIRYQSVFTEAFADMANSVIALSDEEKKANALRIDAALSTSQTMIHSMKGFNKSWFEASKALSIAETIMSTYKAATAALAVQPPPVGIAFASTITALGLANIARIKATKFEGRAMGGSVRANQSYIVGERGMEMFTPNQSGNITPNNELGGVTNINFNIRANDARGFDQLLQQRRGMIVSMINRSLNERGRRSII